MKWLNLLLSLLCVVSSAAQCTLDAVSRLRKVALVIGETDYSSEALGKLRNSIHDAVDIRDALIRLKFDTVEIDTNANYKEIETHINHWLTRIKHTDIAVFYFSGHGGETKGANYIYPIDAVMNDKQLFYHSTYPVNTLIQKMEAANPNVNILILDACRTLPLLRGKSAKIAKLNSGFSDINLSGLNPHTHGTLICFPTASGRSTSDDGMRSRNGLYTEALLKYIERPRMSITSIFQHVKDEVGGETGYEQNPAIYTSLGSKDDFCLSFGSENASSDLSNADTIFSTSLHNLRNSQTLAPNDRLHQVKDIFGKASSVLNSVVNTLRDSLGADYSTIQSGNGSSYETPYWGNRYGIYNIFHESKRIWPLFDLSVRADTVYFALKSSDAYLLNFETENQLWHEKVVAEPFFNINWPEISAFVKNYFSRRLQALK